MTMHFESTSESAYVIGAAPHRTWVGMAYCDKCQDPYVVIVNETTGQRVFVSSVFFSGVVGQVIQSLRIDWDRYETEQQGECIGWCLNESHLPS